jgi:acyl homoserine lactone synthase
MNIISGKSEVLSKALFSQVASYRHQVFVRTLGWNLNSPNDEEIDQFDHQETCYVVSRDENGQVNGCARLLPTHRPYLLGEIFPELMNGLPVPCSPEVWELSRFAAVDLQGRKSTALTDFSKGVAAALLREAINYAAAQGAKRLITVSPVGIERLLRHAGVRGYRAGPPMLIDGQAVVACWIDMPGSKN